MAQSVDDARDVGQGHAICGFCVRPRRQGSGVGVQTPKGHQIQLRVEHLPIELIQRQAPPATLTESVRQIPRELRDSLERDVALVRTGLSAAGAYGWDELIKAGAASATWSLDAYLPVEAFDSLQAQLNQLDLEGDAPDLEPNDGDPDAGSETNDSNDSSSSESVLLRVVDELWPFPPTYALAA